MDLWIRSQDREKLVLTKEFETQHTNYDGGCQIFAVWQNNYQMVGKYKSKERALEVLDEIQGKLKGTFLMKMKKDGLQKVIPTVKEHFERLNSVCIVTGDENFDLEPINKDIYVYEMPKE